jgi:hypothetical protein
LIFGYATKRQQHLALILPLAGLIQPLHFAAPSNHLTEFPNDKSITI